MCNFAHNEGVKTGKTYLVLWDAYLTHLKAGYGGTMNFALMKQHPNVPGVAEDVEAHAMRRRDLIGWAQRNGISVIDVHNAFLESGTARTSLVDRTAFTHLMPRLAPLGRDCQGFPDRRHPSLTGYCGEGHA